MSSKHKYLEMLIAVAVVLILVAAIGVFLLYQNKPPQAPLPEILISTESEAPQKPAELPTHGEIATTAQKKPNPPAKPKALAPE